MSATIGVVGLGVMGAALARNLARNGFGVVGYDADPARTRAVADGAAAGAMVAAADSFAAFAGALSRPRRILVMVPAGPPVDDAVGQLLSHLSAGDILIDGGNSWFLDTERRSRELASHGVQFLGTGVSGGEEGALWGPSLMPGGTRAAYDALAPVLSAIAARAEDGEPCVDYMGRGGSGHYVKMVHNGIEYADMQLIAEIYDVLSRGAGLSAPELHDVFSDWNAGELQSYLIEITAEILASVDRETGRPFLDVILDEASHKGTGKWTSQNALDVGAPIPTINAAVESRLLSALKPERVAASRLHRGPGTTYAGARQRLIDAARDALYASKVTSYAQGMALLRRASTEYAYDLRPGEIAKIWRGGCIIRARLLGEIMEAFRRDPALPNLLLDDRFCDALARRQEAWRFLIQTGFGLGIPVPALAASLAYFDAYRSERLPANLTQAQRDYFGAHTYRRVDRDGSFHTDWRNRR
ncbi:MAG TPA: NADP-dependent phosphogluconate dehydrogenase [Vicinamibacterales bacterium]|nr:NADP-dependent phosphogluconate dehydrogenase [Vicinamibacterales bacterium]